MDLKRKIQTLVKGEVEDNEETLKRYSRDASLFEVKPRLVVFPKDAQDISRLISFVSQHPEEKLSLACRGGGSDMTGGPLIEGIVLDMTRHFNQIKEIGESYAVTEPGVFYRDFEKEAAKKNLFLPCFPASKDLCTLGGMVGNNAGGEKTLRYGQTEDYVEKLKAVLSDGNEYEFRALSPKELEEKMRLNTFEGRLYRDMHELLETHQDIIQKAKPNVSKNSAGYALWNVRDPQKETFDLTRLLTGSQGTLGIITEITFRLVIPSRHSALLVILLPTLDPLAETIQAVLAHAPESFESYDNHTFRLALKFFPDMVKILKGNAVSLAFQFFPEFLLLVKGGIPKLVLLAEFTGESPEEAREKAKKTELEVQKLGVRTRIAGTAKEIEKYLTIRRESFNLLRRHPGGLRTAPFIDDIIVRPEYLEEFLPELNALLARYPQMIYTVAGHVGDGNFHIIPLMDISSPGARELIQEVAQKVFALTLKFRGSLTAEHNDGIVRTPFLKDMFGEPMMHLFSQVKSLFDPQNILNPGKKVGISLEYMKDHIAP